MFTTLSSWMSWVEKQTYSSSSASWISSSGAAAWESVESAATPVVELGASMQK